jgi:predicted RNA-binding protein YlxR (DUF448 family)
MAKKCTRDDEEVLDLCDDRPHVPEGGDILSHPIRTCIATREKASKDSLIRFVLAPDLTVVPDIKGVLPGRGVWTARSWAAVHRAATRGAFPKAFRKSVKVDAGLAAQVAELLKRSMLERLSIAKKAGLVVLGSVKIEDAIKRNELIALFHATDAAPGGCEKLDRKFRAATGQLNHTCDGIALTSTEISLATGSANAIHAGIKAGGAASAFLSAAKCYGDYCAVKTDEFAR